MIFSVEVKLFNELDLPYAAFGSAEFSGPNADTEAMNYARQRIAKCRDAAACVMRDGDPYAWVFNKGGDTAKPTVEYVGRGIPDNWV